MNVALIGNQNCGKTSLFNLLTGGNQKVGNWPGVTIEKKEGIIKNTDVHIIDLPGIYSLSPYTKEEIITRDYIINENIDLIINVIDITSMERSLYLTSQLSELDIDMIVVLNMVDLASKYGITYDKNKLSRELGFNVYEVSCLKNIGITNLIDAIKKPKIKKGRIVYFTNEIESYLNSSNKCFLKHNIFYNLEKISSCSSLTNKKDNNVNDLTKRIEQKYECSIDEIIAKSRFDKVESICKRCINIRIASSKSEEIDRILLNKYLAIPIFIAIMCIIYYLSISLVGGSLTSILGSFGELIKNYVSFALNRWNCNKILSDLIVNGILNGVFKVLVFIPQLFTLFILLATLESSGYMSRIAFIFDLLFKKIGLSGKSLIPFIIGSGCSVPAIMCSRTIENEDERNMTIAVTSFIPCSAKLPIIIIFSTTFYDNFQWFVAISLYLLAIFIIVFFAFFFKHTFNKDKSNNFISELPDYKMPKLENVMKETCKNLFHYIKRAGSIIFIASIIVWFSLSFDFSFNYQCALENSIMATFGKLFSYLFYPMLGTNSWAAAISAIQGIIAKEQVVVSMQVMAGIEGSANIFDSNIFSFFNDINSYSFLVFNLFSAPCLGTLAAIKREFNSTKKMLLVANCQIIFAFIISYITYGLGLLFKIIF